MKEIYRLSQIYRFKIIEDASHALGGSYCKIPIGSCKWSDITIFSFHPVKIITCAEGGIATTNNEKYASKMQIFKSHGITKDTKRFKGKNAGAWYYEQQFLGFNYRLSELHAALGISQLTRLEEYVRVRNALVKTYNENLSNLELILPYVAPYNYSAFHLYVILLTKKAESNAKNYLANYRQLESVRKCIISQFTCNPFMHDLVSKKETLKRQNPTIKTPLVCHFSQL